MSASCHTGIERYPYGNHPHQQLKGVNHRLQAVGVSLGSDLLLKLILDHTLEKERNEEKRNEEERKGETVVNWLALPSRPVFRRIVVNRTLEAFLFILSW